MSITTRLAGIYEDVPELEYHADSAFSQSQAKVLLRSPAKYLHSLTNPQPPKREFDFGHAAHARILGVGLDVVTIDAPDWRTKAAKDAADEARAAGKVPLLAHEVAKVDAMALALEDHPEARRILTHPGRAEVSMWWHDERTGVACRGRVDYLAETPAGLVNVDYKTTTDASPAGFSRKAADFGYHVQASAYEDGLAHLTGDRVPCVLIAQEKDAPYLVGVHRFSDYDLDRGLDRWRDALDLLVRCRAEDHWPRWAGADSDINELALPAWA